MTRRQDPSIIHMTPEWCKSVYTANPGVKSKGEKGIYVPARPLGYPSWRYRLRAVYLVWTGRADALVWPNDQ